jgi:acyl-CoA synthetase (AMP-forming)/AMP-acid ligase II
LRRPLATEATIDCLGQIYQKQDEQEYYREQIAIGKPFNHMMAALIDEDEKFLGTNNKGELVLAGPQVASGYWHNTALSTQKFKMLTHPKWGMQRWFLTGDYCFQDSEGIFHYIKRLDNQCKILGNRIELEEIEFQVRNLAGCTDAVACLINNGAEKEIAVIMNSIILDRELLLKQLKDRLPSYMLPSCILYREALLYNVHGKIDRAALAEWAAHNIDGGIGNAAC